MAERASAPRRLSLIQEQRWTTDCCSGDEARPGDRAEKKLPLYEDMAVVDPVTGSVSHFDPVFSGRLVDLPHVKALR
jgi:hypothetical protein